MSERGAYELDAALEALARDERAACPAVSDHLRARVLADAAEVSAEVSTAIPAGVPGAHAARAARGRGAGWVGWLRGRDLWAGAAVAAALICLAIGLGVGYGVGETVLAEVGFEDMRLAQASEDEIAFLAEDVL